jgi:hypothetical protein
MWSLYLRRIGSKVRIGDVMLGDPDVNYSYSRECVSQNNDISPKASHKTKNNSHCPKLPGQEN